MKIKKLILGPMQVNGYVVSNDVNQCIIIDPGDIGKKVVNYVEQNELEVVAILLTHGHFDHIGAVDYLYQQYRCDIYSHEESISLLHDTNLNLSSFETPFIVEAPIKVSPKRFSIAGFTIEWMFLPGHCAGSSMIHFVNEHVIFSGDVLFKGSIGRFDFPTSSRHDTRESLQKIKELEYDASVYPGHGEETTLSYEKQTNPYLQG